MWIEEDMFYERKRKEVMLTPKDASLKSEVEERLPMAEIFVTLPSK